MSSFGALQRALTQRCINLMIEGNEDQAKADLSDYINYLRSKEPLLEQFYVYDNLLNHTETDRDLAIMFIKETINQIAGMHRGDILTSNTLLKHKYDLEENVTPVEDAINTLIEAKVSDFNYKTSATASAFKTVLEHVQTEKPQSEPLHEMFKKKNLKGYKKLEFFTPQDVVRIGVKKFNQEYAKFFTERERTLFEKLRTADDETLAQIYEDEYATFAKEAYSFLNEVRLDEDIVRNLNLAKDKLKGDCNIDNLLNIVELRNQMDELRSQSEAN